LRKCSFSSRDEIEELQPKVRHVNEKRKPSGKQKEEVENQKDVQIAVEYESCQQPPVLLRRENEDIIKTIRQK
jgi:hypothetical protein